MPQAGGRASRAIGAALAVAALAVVNLLHLDEDGVLTEVATLGAALTAAWFWLRSARWATGGVALGLVLLGLGSAAWAAATGVWFWHKWTTGSFAIPWESNLGFAVTLTTVPTGIILFVGGHPAARTRTLLDGSIISLSLLYLGWAAMLGPLYRAGGGGLSGVASLAFPLADILIASMLLIMSLDSHARLRFPLVTSAIGMLCMFLADGLYSYEAVGGHYGYRNLIIFGWFVSYLIVVVAIPQQHELRGLSAMTGNQASRVPLPYVPQAAVFVTAVVLFVVQRGQVQPPLYVLSLTLTGLVVLRQLVTLEDNQLLTRRLAVAVDDLRIRAEHDPLTGLANRASFQEAAERALADALAVLYIDLDDFKPINDTRGHTAGDGVLIAVAQRLTSAARSHDVVARLGGDEFAILLRDSPDQADAERVADRILTALADPIDLGGNDQVRIGASIGIACAAAGRGSIGEVLRNADMAMYAAKMRGRHQTVTFEPGMLSLPRAAHGGPGPPGTRAGSLVHLSKLRSGHNGTT